MNYLDECAAFTSQSGTSEAAEQGTFLHDLMDQMIKSVVNKRAKTTLEQIATWVVKRHELTDEEIYYLRFCCKKVDAFLARNPSDIHTEISVTVTHPDGSELNHGFLDVLFVFGDTGILIDFKFGWGAVRPARTNLQGFNYALGCFQKFPALNRIGVSFVQPKLNLITEHVIQRTEMEALYVRLRDTIDRAEFVQAMPDQAQQFMKAGKYCDYCALKGSCSVLANSRAVVAAQYNSLPMPPSFKGLELSRPEDIALARYWVDIIETGLSEVKAKAFEAAKNNGGEISCTLPNGDVVSYEIKTRNTPRVLGAATEVAEALKEIVTPEEVLAAADLAITKLEPIVKNAAAELAKARGEKITKKAAWESAEATLSALGLLSRPDTKVEFLKLKNTTQKQVKEING